MRLSISSRHRFARFFMSSAAPAPAAPAAGACCRFASSSSTKGASIWLMMASSWIFANIFSGSRGCMTVPSRAACSRRFAERVDRLDDGVEGLRVGPVARVAPLRRQREQGVVAPLNAPSAAAASRLRLGLDELRQQRVVRPERVAVEARLARALAPRLARHLGVLLDAGRDGRRARTCSVSTTTSPRARAVARSASASTSASIRACASSASFVIFSTMSSVARIMSTRLFKPSRSSMSSLSSALSGRT